jgi:cytochrome c oxidase subunit 4
MADHHESGQGGAWYRTYVVTWLWLLIITGLEISVVLVGLGKALVVTLLLVLALMKAALIAGYFMHLRYERLNLIYVVITPLILAVILFTGVAPDALNAFHLRR